jgi:hypothetical protein
VLNHESRRWASFFSTELRRSVRFAEHAAPAVVRFLRQLSSILTATFGFQKLKLLR